MIELSVQFFRLILYRSRSQPRQLQGTSPGLRGGRWGAASWGAKVAKVGRLGREVGWLRLVRLVGKVGKVGKVA